MRRLRLVDSGVQSLGPAFRSRINARPLGSLLNNLVARWSLDEASGTRSDSVGENDLTDNNTVTQATAKLGDGAAQFTAANNEYLSIAAGSANAFAADKSFTIAAWVYPDDLNNVITIAASGDDSGRDNFSLYVSPSGESIGALFAVYKDGGNAFSFSGSDLATEEWQHVAGVFDIDAGSVTVYVDGQAGIPGNMGGALTGEDGDPFYVGRDVGDGSPDYFNGRIDELAYWSRALSSGEIAQLYNGGAGKEWPY